MDIYELVERVGGEIVVGRARVRQDRGYVVIGEMIDGELRMTKAGIAMAAELGTAPAAEPGVDKPRRGRPKKAESPEEPELDLSILGD